MKKYYAKDYKVLWHSGYYDGALSGCLKINEELCWFDCVFEDFTECNCNYLDEEDGVLEKSFFMSRTYAIYKPTNEQKEILINNHKMFEKYVGTNCNWDCRWTKEHKDNIKPGKSWKQYYNNIKNKPRIPNFEPNQIIGFTSMNELYKSRSYNDQI